MTDERLAKIAITPTADSELNKALDLVNKNFLGGRITKADLASYLIAENAKTLDDQTVKAIQKLYFKQVTYLDSLVKKLKSEGQDSLTPAEYMELRSMFAGVLEKKRGQPQKEATEQAPAAQQAL
jgi:hypothetical protein